METTINKDVNRIINSTFDRVVAIHREIVTKPSLNNAHTQELYKELERKVETIESLEKHISSIKEVLDNNLNSIQRFKHSFLYDTKKDIDKKIETYSRKEEKLSNEHLLNKICRDMQNTESSIKRKQNSNQLSKKELIEKKKRIKDKLNNGSIDVNSGVKMLLSITDKISEASRKEREDKIDQENELAHIEMTSQEYFDFLRFLSHNDYAITDIFGYVYDGQSKESFKDRSVCPSMYKNNGKVNIVIKSGSIVQLDEHNRGIKVWRDIEDYIDKFIMS